MIGGIRRHAKPIPLVKILVFFLKLESMLASVKTVSNLERADDDARKYFAKPPNCYVQWICALLMYHLLEKLQQGECISMLPSISKGAVLIGTYTPQVDAEDQVYY